MLSTCFSEATPKKITVTSCLQGIHDIDLEPQTNNASGGPGKLVFLSYN
jgi:hypothetical protein